MGNLSSAEQTENKIPDNKWILKVTRWPTLQIIHRYTYTTYVYVHAYNMYVGVVRACVTPTPSFCQVDSISLTL